MDEQNPEVQPEEPDASPTQASQNSGDIGIVYILQNPAMPDFVKIGFTQDLQVRMRALDNTSVPVPFECVYAAQVNKPRAWEQTIHDVFQDQRINRRREFFESTITGKVMSILKTAQISEISPTAPEEASDSDADSFERVERRRERSGNFDFEVLEIPVGAKLQFVNARDVTCEVVSQKPPLVDFRGERLRLSNAAAKALSKGSARGIQGSLYWMYGEETLVARRSRLESEAEAAESYRQFLSY